MWILLRQIFIRAVFTLKILSDALKLYFLTFTATDKELFGKNVTS